MDNIIKYCKEQHHRSSAELITMALLVIFLILSMALGKYPILSIIALIIALLMLIFFFILFIKVNYCEYKMYKTYEVLSPSTIETFLAYFDGVQEKYLETKKEFYTIKKIFFWGLRRYYLHLFSNDSLNPDASPSFVDIYSAFAFYFMTHFIKDESARYKEFYENKEFIKLVKNYNQEIRDYHQRIKNISTSNPDGYEKKKIELENSVVKFQTKAKMNEIQNSDYVQLMPDLMQTTEFKEWIHEKTNRWTFANIAFLVIAILIFIVQAATCIIVHICSNGEWNRAYETISLMSTFTFNLISITALIIEIYVKKN